MREPDMLALRTMCRPFGVWGPSSRRAVGAAAALLVGLVATGALAQGKRDAAAPVKLGVVTLQRQTVPLTVTLPGRAVAFEEVDIRPRVDGLIQQILYTPGQRLTVGDPMFQLDDASYAATVASGEAALQKAQVDVTTAQRSVDRLSKLVGSSETQATLDTAKASLGEAQAAQASATAALDFARTQLSWTTIRSPIEGIPDVQRVSVGDIVTASQTDALTTVTRLDPIYVDLLDTSARRTSMRSELAAGTLERNARREAKLTLENGDVFDGSGTLVAPGRTVSTTTGTLTLRFQFDNPRHEILPGMFLRGEVQLASVDAVLVPQRATTRDAAGRITAFVVGDDGTAKKVSFADVGTHGSDWIVRDGLEAGTRVVVDGLMSLKEGQPIDPVPSRIDGDGLVVDAPDGGAAPDAPTPVAANASGTAKE